MDLPVQKIALKRPIYHAVEFDASVVPTNKDATMAMPASFANRNMMDWRPATRSALRTRTFYGVQFDHVLAPATPTGRESHQI